jgi:hypothetical protein
MLDEPNKQSKPNRKRLMTMVALSVILVIEITLLPAVFVSRPQGASQVINDILCRVGLIEPSQVITAKDLEERFGVQVTLIGVTAGGGLVDFRFKVTDPAKAEQLFEGHENMPFLIPQGSDIRLGMPMFHSPRLETGRIYYFLYGNARGVVQPGTPVTVAFGNLHLEPIIAQ